MKEDRRLLISDPFFEAMEDAASTEGEIFWAYFGREEGGALVLDRAELVPEKVHEKRGDYNCLLDSKRFEKWVKKRERKLGKGGKYSLIGLGHVHRNLQIPTVNDTEYLSKIDGKGIHSIYHDLPGKKFLRFFRARDDDYLPLDEEVLNRSEKYQNVEILTRW